MPDLACAPESPVPSQRLLKIAVLALLALAVAWSFRGTIGNPDCQDLDFGAYYRAGSAVARGETPYAVDHHGPLGCYPYAPAYAYFCVPLACLDYLWACRLWLALNWLVTLACLLLTLALTAGVWQRKDAWPVALLTLLPMAAYLWANLRVGQVGALMLLGCLGWAVCRRRGWPFAGGLMLATACALKLAPGLLVVYLLLRRDWRGLAGICCGGLALFLLPAFWIGCAGTIHLHREWMQHTSATHVAQQTFRPGNQSLLAQLARLPVVSNGHVLHSEDNLNALYRIYPFVVLGLAAALLFWVVRDGHASRALPAAQQQHRENLHLALLLIFLTLVHPRAWRCNFVALLVPCVLLAEQVWRRRAGWHIALAALTGLAVACAWPTRGVGEAGWGLGSWLLLGKHFWGALGVATACVWCTRENSARRSRPQALQTNRGELHIKEEGRARREPHAPISPRAGSTASR